MTHHSKFEQLLKLLDESVQLAAQFTGGYSNNFFSAEEFHSTLTVRVNKLKSGDIEQLNKLWLWFSPTCDWDDFIHQEGTNLANEIYSLMTELRD